EAPGARAASRLAAAHGAALAVAARRRRSARRLPALPDRHEDAVSRPRRSVDGGAPGARPALVRARDREGARAGVRTLLSPRRRPRRHLHPGRPVRALRAAVPPAPARMVPRGRGARAACRQGATVTGPAAEVRALGLGDEKAVEELLEAHPDSSLFLRRNLTVNGLVDRGELYHGAWAAAFEGGRLVAVAQHSRFGSVLLQA